MSKKSNVENKNARQYSVFYKIGKNYLSNNILKEKYLENPGIDPGTSHMLSERSTI